MLHSITVSVLITIPIHPCKKLKTPLGLREAVSYRIHELIQLGQIEDINQKPHLQQEAISFIK